MNRTMEWLNENQNRRYPFVDDADLSVAGHSFVVPNDLLLDIQATSTLGVSTYFVLLDFTVAPDSKSIRLHFVGGEPTYALQIDLNIDVPVTGVWPYTTVMILQVPYWQGGPGVVGTLQGVYTVTLGPGVVTLAQNPPGTYTLAHPPQINPGLLMEQGLCRVDSLTSSDLNYPHDEIVGPITVQPGYNCETTCSDGVLSFRAGSGFGAGVSCDLPGAGTPDPTKVSCAEALLWFSGVSASQDGNVELAAGPGVVITPDPEHNTIYISGAKSLPNKEC